MKHLIPFLFAAVLVAEHASAQYQSQPTEESRKLPPGSAAERKARMSGRANAVAYTKKFDLSGLPHYVPEEKPTGKLRVYGNNYLGDAPLGRWWKEAFEKAQPGIQVEYYLPSAAIAVPGLYFGLADIAIARPSPPEGLRAGGLLRFHRLVRLRGLAEQLRDHRQQGQSAGEDHPAAARRHLRFGPGRRLGGNHLASRVQPRPRAGHPHLGSARTDRRMGRQAHQRPRLQPALRNGHRVFQQGAPGERQVERRPARLWQLPPPRRHHLPGSGPDHRPRAPGSDGHRVRALPPRPAQGDQSAGAGEDQRGPVRRIRPRHRAKPLVPALGRSIALGQCQAGHAHGREDARVHPLRAQQGSTGAGAARRQVPAAHRRGGARGTEEARSIHRSDQ